MTALHILWVPKRGQLLVQGGDRRRCSDRRNEHIYLQSVPTVYPAAESTQSGNPIKIGYGISQTGGIALNGRSALLAQRIWKEDVNAKGGLLGRPIKLVQLAEDRLQKCGAKPRESQANGGCAAARVIPGSYGLASGRKLNLGSFFLQEAFAVDAA